MLLKVLSVMRESPVPVWVTKTPNSVEPVPESTASWMKFRVIWIKPLGPMPGLP